MMKRKIFVIFICLIGLLISAGCSKEKCDTPEKAVAKLFSGKIDYKEVNDILDYEEHYFFPESARREHYQAVGYKDHDAYEDRLFHTICNIDHTENLTMDNIANSLYSVKGTIYLKDGSISHMNHMVHISEDVLSENNPTTKYRILFSPFIFRMGRQNYSTFDGNGNLLFKTELSAYFQGNKYLFIAIFKNYTDEQYIISNWPNGANIIWGDKYEEIPKPIVIKPQNEPIGTTEDGENYHATIAHEFELGRTVQLDEAVRIINDNYTLVINYCTEGKNGLPSPSSQEFPLVFERDCWKNPKYAYKYN